MHSNSTAPSFEVRQVGYTAQRNFSNITAVAGTAACASRPKAHRITGGISPAALKAPVQARKPGDTDTQKPAP